MTGPEDSQAGTRPISVAELLAKNGTIGAPPVGGRRRRRRGNSDAVTVAELTGEIPVITDDLSADDLPVDDIDENVEFEDEPDVAEAEPVEPPAPVAPPRPARAPKPVRPAEAPRKNGQPAAGAARTRNVVPDPARTRNAVPDAARNRDVVPDPARLRDAEDDYRDHLKSRAADPEPVEFKPRRKPPARDYRPSGTGAERMSPDFIDDELDDVDIAGDPDDERSADAEAEFGSAWFGGDPDAAEAADLDLADAHDREREPDFDEHDLDVDEFGFDDFDDRDRAESRGTRIARGAWIGAQCTMAVAFGAGLFMAFLQLWKWNVIVALVLGVLVILGLAGGVRIVRKTEDIGSTLIAVAVGALVTFGPLALQAALQGS